MAWFLVRHAHGLRRRLRVVVGSIAVGMTAGLLLWWCAHPSMSECELAVRHSEWRRGVDLCLASYKRTGKQHDLAWAAKAYMYLNELDQADKLARQVLVGPFDGDAHQILGYVALRRELPGVAREHAAAAMAAHTRAGDERGQANDAVLLSQAAWQIGDFAAALSAADEAISLARRLGDPRREVTADIARADALRRLGDNRGAAATLAHAIERATDPCDKAFARLRNGMCQVEAGQEGLALPEFDLAEQANRRCGSREVATAVAIIQAWLLRWRDPSAAVARLDELAKSMEDSVETMLLRGYLAADRGALADADRYLALAANLDVHDAAWQSHVACARAELSEAQRGRLGDWLAEYHYRQSTALVAALRATARARSAYFVSSHRDPYDGLIALLARNGRWRPALAVVLELDASDMLRATADELAARDRASFVDLDTQTPSLPVTPGPTVEDVLAAWRSRDLVIVIAQSERDIGAGRERVYRMRVTDGEITGEDVGDASTARKWANDLFADPDDQVAARALGRMLVPPGAASSTLHVLAIGALGKVPLAALRDDRGSLIIARRPLVRVLALRATRPEAGSAGPPVVIADPRGDLPGAAVEGAVVAQALGPAVRLSGTGTPYSATRDRLWAARDAGLLHVAGHVRELGRWRTLHLADGDVDPAEMVQRGLAPRIAVLAGCGSAAALDEEGWGSIAAALLESGTAVVIATDRSVGDATSLSVMRDFYAQPDWRTDPARALARVQQALDARADASSEAAMNARSWAAFSVLARPPTVPERSAADRIRAPGAR